ncbi:MAG TPA: TetR/AcrR family transcriptional regulator [Streptosporangiaceae bacterium]
MSMATPATGRRERRKQQTRERIIAAAAASFAEQGFDGTTFDHIAERADVARATVFNYFGDKQELLRAYLGHRRAWLRALLEDEAAREQDSAARLGRLLDTLAAFNQDSEREARAVLGAWRLMRDPYGDGAPVAEVFGEVIAAGQAAGEFASSAEPGAAALFLFDAYTGVITRWFATAPAARFDLRAALQQALAVVLHGIARQPAKMPHHLETDLP